MSFDLGTLRSALAAKLGTIAGLNVYKTVTPKPEVPAAMIVPTQTTVHLTMVSGSQVNFGIEVLVAAADWPSGQVALDTYVSEDDPNSIIVAVEDSVTTVTMVDGYRHVTIGDSNYFSAVFHVEVLV